jgi:hypothetical protein
MGRRKKYFNEEEKKEANRAKVLRYYWNNKEECDRKARERYLAKKLVSFNKNGTSGSAVPDVVQLQTIEEFQTNDEQH